MALDCDCLLALVGFSVPFLLLLLLLLCPFLEAYDYPLRLLYHYGRFRLVCVVIDWRMRDINFVYLMLVGSQQIRNA